MALIRELVIRVCGLQVDGGRPVVFTNGHKLRRSLLVSTLLGGIVTAAPAAAAPPLAAARAIDPALSPAIGGGTRRLDRGSVFSSRLNGIAEAVPAYGVKVQAVSHAPLIEATLRADSLNAGDIADFMLGAPMKKLGQIVGVVEGVMDVKKIGVIAKPLLIGDVGSVLVNAAGGHVVRAEILRLERLGDVGVDDFNDTIGAVTRREPIVSTRAPAVQVLVGDVEALPSTFGGIGIDSVAITIKGEVADVI